MERRERREIKHSTHTHTHEDTHNILCAIAERLCHSKLDNERNLLGHVSDTFAWMVLFQNKYFN